MSDPIRLDTPQPIGLRLFPYAEDGGPKSPEAPGHSSSSSGSGRAFSPGMT